MAKSSMSRSDNRRGQILRRQRYYRRLLDSHAAKGIRIVVDRRGEVRDFVPTAVLVARQRPLELSDLVRADTVFFFQLAEQSAR